MSDLPRKDECAHRQGGNRKSHRALAKIKIDYANASEGELVFEEASLLKRALRDTFNEDWDQVVINDEKMAKSLEKEFANFKCEVYTGAKTS